LAGAAIKGALAERTGAVTGPFDPQDGDDTMRAVPGRLRLTKRLARAFRADGNPLSRASDRAEAWVRAGLLAVFLAAGPMAALAAGGSVSHLGAETSASARHVHAVKAVLLQPAPTPTATSPYAAAYQGRLVWVTARWDTAGDSARTGQVPAPGGSPAGSVVTVWLDPSGQVTSPPEPGAFANDATLAEVMTLVAVALTLRAALQVTRRFLNRRRLAAWEAAWSSIGPRWTGRRSLPSRVAPG
jgi:hypothetical protein